MRFFVLFLLAACALPGEVPRGEYRERRIRLQQAVQDGVFILAGNTEKDVEDARGAFFQEPNFAYLTGWNQPGAVLVLTPKDEALFIPSRNAQRERWTGPKAAPEDQNIRELTGFATVLSIDSLEKELPRFLEAGPKVYAIENQPFASKLKALLALREISSATQPIARLRMEKSKAELAELQRAADATIAAHRAAWNRMAAGLYEYQIATTMMNVWFDRGCVRNAYAPIVGSGSNATVLHYSNNSRRIDRGELLLVDAAAECGGYAADVTRTVPVNRKFTPRQRELYEVVLGAERAAIAAAKPGMMLTKAWPNSLYKVAYDYIDSHGKDLQGNSLGRYFTHGVSHHLGLEVHDASDPAVPLKPGMVITIEPGIYIPDENIGIRIEDMLLITEDGAKVLTSALPTEPDAIEKALSRSNAPSQ